MSSAMFVVYLYKSPVLRLENLERFTVLCDTTTMLHNIGNDRRMWMAIPVDLNARIAPLNSTPVDDLPR